MTAIDYVLVGCAFIITCIGNVLMAKSLCRDFFGGVIGWWPKWFANIMIIPPIGVVVGLICIIVAAICVIVAAPFRMKSKYMEDYYQKPKDYGE